MMLNIVGIGTFLLITILFFIVRSRPILFHLICSVLIAGFVFCTGRFLQAEQIGEWILLTVGLLLYWFGLVIVRVMLTRSVSLRMLADYDRGEVHNTASEGIASRFQDAATFGLVIGEQDGYRLTPFGKLIAWIVATSYGILRIR